MLSLGKGNSQVQYWKDEEDFVTKKASVPFDVKDT